MWTPGHVHAITHEKKPKRIKVPLNGTVVATTQQTLILREVSLSPVHYISREDVNT